MCRVRTLFAAWAFVSAWRCCLSETRQGEELPGEPCVMGGGVWGFCEEVQACMADGGVVARQGHVHLCRHNPSGIIVCCRKPHLVAKELCDAWAGYWRDERGKCETQPPLIVGGEEAGVGEFPHAVLLGSSFDNNPIIFNCGGTLISPYHVLTAAHCMVPSSFSSTNIKFWVKLGEHDTLLNSTSTLIPAIRGDVPSSLYRSDELRDDPLMASRINPSGSSGDSMIPVEQIIEVEDMKAHPDYVYRVYNYHDIGVIRLKTPARFSKRVLPACLPIDTLDDYRGERLTVVGWGLTSGLFAASTTLQKVDVPVVDGLTCLSFGISPDKLPLGITTDMLCAGENGRDSCKGDSGGPLTRQNLKGGVACEHSVVGVVSFGKGRNYAPCGLIGVYARVTSYLDWITGFIAPNIIATSSSTRT